MSGLLQAGLLMELGLPSGKTGDKPSLHVGEGVISQTLSFLMSHVEMSTWDSL